MAGGSDGPSVAPVLRVAACFALAAFAVALAAVFLINRYFAPPVHEPAAAFVVEQADPELARLARLRAAGANARATDQPATGEPTGPGMVQLQFEVLPDGRATNITVLASTPPGYNERRAMAAIRAQRHDPARSGTRTQVVTFDSASGVSDSR